MQPHSERLVSLTMLPDGTRVSTMFLGIDHGWGDGPPVLWETIAFRPGAGDDDPQERYATYEDAVAGHLRLVDELRRPDAPEEDR